MILPRILVLGLCLFSALSYATPWQFVKSNLARELEVRGLMNIQFAVKDEELYVIEVNPRASRTVPFVSKAIGKPLAKMAAKIMVPAAITLACEDRVVGKRLVELIGTPEFRPYFSTDVAGVEVAGAIKNVLAIASGVVAGLELGDNARAALITRGIAEMSRLAVAMGGRVETMLGLAGLGDLTLTCTGTLSRNYTFGLALGQGRKAKDILAERRSVTEGVYTAASITDVAAKYGVEMPICKAVDQVANHDSDLRSTINGLLQRPFRDELEAAS